jgi:hypothetical protein
MNEFSYSLDVSPRIHYDSVATTTEMTTTTTTTTSSVPLTTREETTTVRTTTVESTSIISSTNPIDQATEVIEHTNNLISSETETSSSVPMTKENHLPNEDYSSSTIISSPSSEIDAVETTSIPTRKDDQITSSIIPASDSITTNEATQKEEIGQTTVVSTQPRLIHLLTNLSHSIPNDNVTPTDEDDSETSTGRSSRISSIRKEFFSLASMTSLNPCTLENLRVNLVYHEYSLDQHKFIFCDSEGKMNVIACSPSYVWSQMEQSCILPN